MTVIVLHELFRNLYFYDPYIKSTRKNHFENLLFCVDNLIKFSQSSSKIGSYKNNLFDTKFDTQILFGKLWKERKNEKMIDSLKILRELLVRSKINEKFLKTKRY